MDAQTHGFDVLYQIDHDSLLASLENLITDQVALRLASVDLFTLLPSPPAPNNSIQQGTLKTFSAPITTLALPAPVVMGDPGPLAQLQIRFPSTLLQLAPVVPVVGFPGVGALPPTAAGELAITLRLAFSATSTTNGATLTIAAHSMTVSELSFLPALSALSSLIALAPLVQQAIVTAVQNALATLFPLPLAIPFGEQGLCGIGVRALAVKILQGSADTKPALGFFATLRSTGQGRIDEATTSTLTVTPNVSGAFVLSNPLLKELVCCLFRQSPDISDLPEPTSEDDNCCHWRDIDGVRLGDQRVKIEELDICIRQTPGAQSTIELTVLASQSGTGWTAYARMTVQLQLLRDGSALGVVQLEPTTETWEDISPWVWILVGLGAAVGALAGAVIGFFVGGPAGAGAGAWKGGVIGAAVGLALVGVTAFVLKAIGALAGEAISGVLGVLGAGSTRLLPKEVTDTFGTISDVVVVDFDDLVVGGRVRPPRRNNTVEEGADVVLRLGDRIDLDRGIIQRRGEQLAGFALEADLHWRPEPLVLSVAERTAPPSDSRSATLARVRLPDVLSTAWTGSIEPLGTARLAAVAASFWSLTQGGLQAINFPATRVVLGSSTIPRTDTPYPANARVFAVRTTAGRVAKCVAWRDRFEQLHLSYVTYNTQLPLWIQSQWTVTRGPLDISTPVANVYQVSRRGRFDANKLGLDWLPGFPPISLAYRWTWDDQPLAGSGTLPDGTTSFAVNGDRLVLQTAMGARLRGVLQVQVDAFGRDLVATLDLDEPGTVRELLLHDLVVAAPEPPPPGPEESIEPPVFDQLPAAFARGMGIPVEKVRFR